jgi:hypothetical protein
LDRLKFSIVICISARRTSNTTAVKQSWTNSKQNIRQREEPLLLSPSNKILSKSHQSDLDLYLSKRRNTTGSISLNKIVDLKNPSNGNIFKLVKTPSTESNIFQTIEDADFLATKQLIRTNENILNS